MYLICCLHNYAVTSSDHVSYNYNTIKGRWIGNDAQGNDRGLLVICLETLKKTRKLRKESQSLIRYLNQEPPEYDAGMLTTDAHGKGSFEPSHRWFQFTSSHGCVSVLCCPVYVKALQRDLPANRDTYQIFKWFLISVVHLLLNGNRPQGTVHQSLRRTCITLIK
jgi:hypothetical protein